MTSVIPWKRAVHATLASLGKFWLKSGRFKGNSLRILAYHDVPVSARFREQMAFLSRHFSVMHPRDIRKVNEHRPRVWITFDDGDPSVIDVGLPILQDFGFHATLFVCPGLIDSREPYWWQAIQAAAARGVVVDGQIVSSDLISRLKLVEDERRLRAVRIVRQALESAEQESFQVTQLSSTQLFSWIAGGNTVGNHTWDHPILSRCEPAVQLEQIGRAHNWLSEHVGPDQLLFAYPNGDWTQVSERELIERGYEYGLLFDHRIATCDNPLQMSRIRVNAGDDLATFISRLSGLHPLVHHALGRP